MQKLCMRRKEVIEKNVDHMGDLRKLTSVNYFSYNKFIDSHLWFIFLHNTTLAHVDCNYF